MESHNWIHDLLLPDDHDIESIDVSYLVGEGKYAAEFDVRWRGDFKDGSFTDLTVAQRWVMYEPEQFAHPVIENYVAVVKSNNLTGD
ncbi:hypothetical protein [Vibrio harveyi]|uniref:hypothetical protein n=1 Tax=Vibrio harveyi TaxID=669 RepID=UPI00057728C1|nr:hypothetical protein [Vibrio harveyi]MBY7698787.1 hypothetical protein [Vibrio harveyi]PNM63113.1 hypothetical protein AL540_008870 [Vibrio harveyi]UIL55936.1 hypothetical protein LXG94_09230 [Vibrio harveyi]